MTDFFAVPRYRDYPMWLVTLDCGHSGKLDPWQGEGYPSLNFSYHCPACPGMHSLSGCAPLPANWGGRW